MIILNTFSDGSSDNNKMKNAGWASCIYLDGKRPIVFYGHLETPATNNQGELLGIMGCIAMSLMFKGKAELNVTSDSQYALNLLSPDSTWSATKNLEYIKLGFRLQKHFSGIINLHWVKGHSGHFGNELADKFCLYGRLQTVVNDPRYNSRYFGSKQEIFDYLEGLCEARE